MHIFKRHYLTIIESCLLPYFYLMPSHILPLSAADGHEAVWYTRGPGQIRECVGVCWCTHAIMPLGHLLSTACGAVLCSGPCPAQLQETSELRNRAQSLWCARWPGDDCCCSTGGDGWNSSLPTGLCPHQLHTGQWSSAALWLRLF